MLQENGELDELVSGYQSLDRGFGSEDECLVLVAMPADCFSLPLL